MCSAPWKSGPGAAAVVSTSRIVGEPVSAGSHTAVRPRDPPRLSQAHPGPLGVPFFLCLTAGDLQGGHAPGCRSGAVGGLIVGEGSSTGGHAELIQGTPGDPRVRLGAAHLARQHDRIGQGADAEFGQQRPGVLDAVTDQRDATVGPLLVRGGRMNGTPQSGAPEGPRGSAGAPRASPATSIGIVLLVVMLRLSRPASKRRQCTRGLAGRRFHCRALPLASANSCAGIRASHEFEPQEQQGQWHNEAVDAIDVRGDRADGQRGGDAGVQIAVAEVAAFPGRLRQPSWDLHRPDGRQAGRVVVPDHPYGFVSDRRTRRHLASRPLATAASHDLRVW